MGKQKCIYCNSEDLFIEDQVTYNESIAILKCGCCGKVNPKKVFTAEGFFRG